ncbi:MAG: transcription regulator HTH, apses-type DNA-binding domain-containing protein, partial [Benniella sp.]
MLGHQQLLQQQHQHQHQHQRLHAHQQQLQQQFTHQDYKANSGHVKQPTPHLPVSAPSTLPACVTSIKPSSFLPPAYPYPGRSGTPVCTPSLPSVSPSSTTLASVSGEGSTGTGEDFVPNIKKAKYSTSLDPRGFIPVYEYDLYGHPIMWDQENLYVHFTGIWKALGKTKADIVKIIDANPILESIIRKVRGGFLKIQGTWMPHQEAYDLAKKTCYKLRHELVPVFG